MQPHVTLVAPKCNHFQPPPLGIDFVFSHDAPASDKINLDYEEIDELNRCLESLRGIMKYDKWFYGHLHDNHRVFENNFLLYEQIIRIN